MLQPNGNIKNQIWVSYQNSIHIPIQKARTSNFLEGFLFLIAKVDSRYFSKNSVHSVFAYFGMISKQIEVTKLSMHAK